MKKLTALLLALLLLCGLAGCSTNPASRAPDSDPEPAPGPHAPIITPPSPQPETDEPDEPEPEFTTEDYFGSWSDDHVYTNKALGITYTLPAGWVYASDEDLLKLMGMVQDNENLSDRTKLMLKMSGQNIIYALYAQDGAGGMNVQIIFENLSEMIGKDMIDEKVYAEITLRQQMNMFVEGSDSSVSAGEIYQAQLAGQEYTVLPVTLTSSGIDVQQLTYLRRVGDYMTLISFAGLPTADMETLEGCVPSFAPLSGDGPDASDASDAADAADESGVVTVPEGNGDIGRTFSTMFFDFTVLSAESPGVYDGYTPADGNRLIVVSVRIMNDFGSILPMYDTDFILVWGEGESDYSWAVDAFNDKMMPPEWELFYRNSAKYDMVFEVPADKTEFALEYLELYTDENDEDQTGDTYDAVFSINIAQAA